FVVIFPSVVDAVEAALLFHHALLMHRWEADAVQTRVGIHLGETVILTEGDGAELTVASHAADMCARLMSLGLGGLRNTGFAASPAGCWMLGACIPLGECAPESVIASRPVPPTGWEACVPLAPPPPTASSPSLDRGAVEEAVPLFGENLAIRERLTRQALRPRRNSRKPAGLSRRSTRRSRSSRRCCARPAEIRPATDRGNFVLFFLIIIFIALCRGR